MASKIKVADLDAKLRAAGIAIDGVALDRPGKKGISIDFQAEATAEQKALADQIIKDYDQRAEDAAKVKPVTEEEINAAKTVNDLKALLIRQHHLRG